MFTFSGTLAELPKRLNPPFLLRARSPSAVPAIPRPKPAPATPLDAGS